MGKSNFERRNLAIREFCKDTEGRYPHWKMEYIIEKAGEKFFLAPRTIEAIVKGEGIYSF